MNRVNDQVRKKTEKNFQRYRRWRRTFYDLVNVYGLNSGISSIHSDERIINLQRTKVYVFSDSVLCLGEILPNPESNEAWEHRLGWIKASQKLQKL